MNPTTVLKRALVFFLVATLTVAPVSYAAETTTPLNYDFVWIVDGGLAEMAFKKVDGGYLYWSLQGDETVKTISDEQLASMGGDKVVSGEPTLITLTDGLGGRSQYWVIPDRENNGVTGRVESTEADGPVRPYSIRFAEDVEPVPMQQQGRFTVRSEAVIVVIGVAAVVGGIACLWNALATDCGDDCVRACGRAGVSSYSEGTCGSCTCRCK